VTRIRATGKCGPLVMSAEDTAPSAPKSQMWRSGERRQLTVMFCDLLGSAEVSAVLDPEELSDVLQLYRSHVGQVIQAYNGTIAQYLGDGVLVYFGYPQANENDAECAIRAGLEIVRQLPSLAHSKFQFNVRIGIATGLVVIGEAPETALKGEILAIGETPNLAARLQAIAPANGILIAESTRRLVGGLFDFANPVSVQVKGFAGPVQAHEVMNISLVESRFEALRGEATPFVGREEEIALLRRRWDQVCQGEGRVVLLSGEPGIGKSRILSRARKEFDSVAGNCLRFYCSPLHSQTALFPFLSHTKKAAALRAEDRDADKLAALVRFSRGCCPIRWRRPRTFRKCLASPLQASGVPHSLRFSGKRLRSRSSSIIRSRSRVSSRCSSCWKTRIGSTRPRSSCSTK
jgi:class 3 adenylate cyclase